MPNAAQRAAIQKRTPPKAKPAPAPAATVAAAPAEAPAEKTPAPKQKSIRNTIMSMLQAGKSTKEISDVVQAEFPGTKAAEKPSKHISFYRSRMKTAGKPETSAE